MKTGRFEIANYLIETGINVNFIEEEDDDPGLRAPVLFDAITATIDSLCVGMYCASEEIKSKFEDSDIALDLLKKMVQSGADVNKTTSNGFNAVNWSLHHAALIMGRPRVYPYSQEKVREQLRAVLDCLFNNGFDYDAWISHGYYPEPSPGPSIRELFMEKPEYMESGNEEYKQTRLFLQDYFNKVKV